VAERKPFLLRLPPDLMDDITRWAQDELRSVNGQIEYLLRDAMRKRRGGRNEESRNRSQTADC
jgi:hypothetical protein